MINDVKSFFEVEEYYNAYVLPVFDFGCVVWGTTLIMFPLSISLSQSFINLINASLTKMTFPKS